MIGQTISHYTILEKLGEGGMGVVYKAQDTRLDRIVAMKFLPAHVSVSEETKSRFLQEARAAAALNHPHICTIHGIEEEGTQLFIVMEYVEGGTLREKLPIPSVKDALAIAIQIGEALQEAHAKWIVHRDVKSDNIMLTSNGQAKVMDFGLAKLKGSLKITRTSGTVGTLAYMAPEQIQGGEADARSDIFSFGAVVFEMFTGHLPFRGEHEAAMMYSILNEAPEPVQKTRPDLPAEIDHIICRALEKDPEDRYQSVADMVSELRREQKKTGKVLRPSTAEAAISRAAAPVITGPMPPPVSRNRTLLFGGLGFGVLAAACAMYLFFGHHQTIDSLAVLPFENSVADPNIEYLSDGMTEGIINSLSKLPGVKLMSRSSVFRFKGKGIDPDKAGKDLGVGAVLTGRLTQRGDALTVSVELVDVKDNSHIWGNQYERKLSEILALQSDISQEISNQLKITLTGDQRRALVEHPTESAEAYKLYLQGLFYWNKRTKDGFTKAISYYQQAINKDPSYGLAYAGLASVYAVQGSYFIISMTESAEKAKALALKALQFDDRLAEAHAVLAALKESYEWKWEDAEREYKRAIELNPNYATAHQWYGEFLAVMGRFDESNAQHQKAIEIDPLAPVTYLSAASDLMVQKRYDEASKLVKRSLEIDPASPRGNSARARIAFSTGRRPDALKDMRSAIALSDSSDEYVAFLSNMLGVTGNRPEATTLLRILLGREQSRFVDPSLIAQAYVGLGETDLAFRWLEKAFHVRSNSLEYLLMDESYEPVRGDPRFAALAKKIGLPQ